MGCYDLNILSANAAEEKSTEVSPPVVTKVWVPFPIRHRSCS